MLIVIIIIALLNGLFFLIAGISMGGFVYNGMKQNNDLQKKCLKIFIPASIAWLFFVGVNIVLIIIFLYNNGEDVAEIMSIFLRLLRK
jgi:uncharacterized membrane protein YdcZ (DUF606 family)